MTPQMPSETSPKPGMAVHNAISDTLSSGGFAHVGGDQSIASAWRIRSVGAGGHGGGDQSIAYSSSWFGISVLMTAPGDTPESPDERRYALA